MLWMASLRDPACGRRRLAEEVSRQRSTDGSSCSTRTTVAEERARREAEDMVRDSTERYVAYLRDAVLRDMEQWPQVLVRTRAGGTLKARRAALWDGYRTYGALRALQDQLDDTRRRQALTADQARLFFHVSDAVRDVRAALLAAQAPLGKSYSYKSEEWLVDRRRRAKRVLDDQKLEAGQAPWPPTRKAPTSAHTNGDQSSSEAGPDRTQSSSHASQSTPHDSGEPPPVPRRPSPRASSPSGSPTTAPHAESSAHLTAAMRLVWAGVAVATLAVLAWFAHAHLVDALTVALGVAALAGLAWVLIVNKEARRGLGLLLLGIVKLTWLVLRGFGALALGLISLIGKRR